MRSALACCAGAGALLLASAAMAEPSRDVKVLCARTAACGLTFVAELGNAPFPVGPDALDHRGKPFWHGVDAASGQRVRVLDEKRRYTEAAVYGSARVLFHAAKAFDPSRRFRLVLFLHGHGSEIERTVARELDLPGQLDRAGVNAALIAPQLALDASESAPGKLVEPGRAAALIDEAQLVLSRVVGGDAAAWGAARIVIVAYSGGYRSAAQIVDHGGLDGRIEGLVLLDAIYGDAGLYASWLARHHHRAFFWALYTKSSAEETELLKTRLIERGIGYRSGDDGGPLAGIRFVETDTPHGEIAKKGPPAEPVGALLKRLPM